MHNDAGNTSCCTYGNAGCEVVLMLGTCLYSQLTCFPTMHNASELCQTIKSDSGASFNTASGCSSLFSQRDICVLKCDIHKEVCGLVSREQLLVANVQAWQADPHGFTLQKGCVEAVGQRGAAMQALSQVLMPKPDANSDVPYHLNIDVERHQTFLQALQQLQCLEHLRGSED